MYLGPFYLNTKELFLIIAALLIGLAMYFNWPLMWFDNTTLFTLVIIILITKGLLPSIHNVAFFINALVTILLSLYFPLFQVILFYFISFILFKGLKVI